MQLLDWATGPENARVNTMLGNFVPYPHILESEICRRAHPWLAMVKRETIRERERLITRKGRAIEAMEIDTLLFEALLQASRGGQNVKKVLDRFQEQMETLLR